MKILHITSSLDGGGIASLLMDYCSRMIPEMQFDFAITAKQEGFLEEPLKKLGCNIFRIEQFRVNPVKYTKQLIQIIRDGKYDIVHDHADYRSFPGLMCAKICGSKIRIAHSHLAYVELSKKAAFEKKIFTPIVKHLATNLVACSKAAAQWTWGETQQPVHIMTNAIETQKFAYSEEKRIELRRKYDVENKLVIGNVARFSYQKNHEMLLKIFKKIAESNENAVLVLIGDGELLEETKKSISALNLTDRVILLGTRSDVPDLLNMMDCFVLPSRFEGLGIVYVEAQCNGLHAFGTEDVVPKEANINGGLTYINTHAQPNEWAQQILSFDLSRRGNAVQYVINAGYDINKAADSMRRYYLSL